LKAGKVIFEAKDRTVHSKQVLKGLQCISGLSDRMQRVQHQRFERILVTNAKPFPQKSTMNVGRSNCQRQVSCYSSPHCRYQELKDADGDFGD
jgi:hypothetical protein